MPPRHHRKRSRFPEMPALFVALAIPGCGFGDAADDMPSDSAYVEVMAHLSLVHAQIAGRDSARADSARREVLDRHGIEAEALRRYAERYGDDPEHMSTVWTAVTERMVALDSAARAADKSPEDDPDRTEDDPGGNR